MFPGAPRMVPALISAQGRIVWESINQIDGEFVKLIGKQILKQGWKQRTVGL